MATRLAPLIDPPITFAHRGASAHARENTLEAFALAREMGAAGIETDAWRTSDDQIVLDHDGSVGLLARLRGIGSRRPFGRPIAQVRRAELPSHIPTLDEYYTHCGTSLELSVDVKDPSAFAGLVAAARRNHALERLWACHRDLDTLQRWRSETPEVKLVHSTQLDRLPSGPERHAADLARVGIDAVNLRCEAWTGGLTTLYHRFGVYALGWDAQQERQIAELLDCGIDGVYGDHVDRLVAVLARISARR